MLLELAAEAVKRRALFSEAAVLRAEAAARRAADAADAEQDAGEDAERRA